MAGKLESVVDNLIEGMHQISKIETVVGEPLQAGDAMLVPIHRIRMGFGAASLGAGGHGEQGEGQYGGRGVGGGVQIEPIAVVSVSKDGRPRLMAIDGEPEQMVGQLLDQIPDVLGRVLSLLTGRSSAKEARKDAEPAAIGEKVSSAQLPENESK